MSASASDVRVPTGDLHTSNGDLRVPTGDVRLSTVDVIVPCHNYGHLLEDCLDSVLGQQEVDVRVLVIDDCSSDDSAQVAQRLAARDDRIELRTHRDNVGLIATANEGLEWSQGDFVVLLSADDLLAPGALGRAASVMADHPNVGMVYGRALRAIEGRPLPRPTGRWRATKVWRGTDWIRLRCHSAHNCVASPEVVVRGQVQRAVGGYDPRCRHCSDLNMWLRVAAVSDVAYIRGAPQAIYRVHARSMWRSQQGPVEELRERAAAFDAFFAAPEGTGIDWSGRDTDGDGSDTDGHDGRAARAQLRALAGRTLARQALWRASRAVDRGEHASQAQELVELALRAHPDARRLREWRGLALRRRLGPRRSRAFLPFLASGAAHRMRHHARWMRLRFRGV